MTADEPARRDPALPGLPVAVVEDAAARAGLRARRLHRAPQRRGAGRRARPRAGRGRRRDLAHGAARRAPARPRDRAPRRGVARHLPRLRRPRRRAQGLPQRLPLLLRRSGARRTAPVALGEGRRLPAQRAGRQLHHAQQPHRRRPGAHRGPAPVAALRLAARLGRRGARAPHGAARRAGPRTALERLAAAGLELHLQVVLCPGWNDGAVARRDHRRCRRPGVGARRRHRARLAGRRGRRCAA